MNLRIGYHRRADVIDNLQSGFHRVVHCSIVFVSFYLLSFVLAFSGIDLMMLSLMNETVDGVRC